MPPAETDSPPQLEVERPSDERLRVRLSGHWRTAGPLPGVEALHTTLRAGGVKRLEFDTTALGGWDSRFIAFVAKCQNLCRESGCEVADAGLPEGVRALLRLAEAVPEKKDASRRPAQAALLQRLGEGAQRGWEGARNLCTFLGENVLALGRLLRGRAQFRWPDAFLVMQECGPQALGIVALINFLIGLIMAFVGATALAQFGASIYVADMVAIATVREMGCIMTGIILCGRTGAAFAAQLGTMKVNEEISALQTFGISAVEFLVLPRMIALMVMMPLLCAFADLISISGGMLVSMTMLDVSPEQYLARTLSAIQVDTFLLGIAKGSFFGFLVAYTGCLRGMQCGSNAAAVGQATTRAVVAGITSIIASDGLFAVLCNALHI
jgi:phospholipid/cholesterol/gamma-HCH transport system permease protein